ncbi:hypothetical protein Tco_0154608 [Tanacetum coccineum]
MAWAGQVGARDFGAKARVVGARGFWAGAMAPSYPALLVAYTEEVHKFHVHGLSINYLEVKICGGKEEDVGLDELGEGGNEVVSKIGEFGGYKGSELHGDRGGEVLFGGGEGGEGKRL